MRYQQARDQYETAEKNYTNALWHVFCRVKTLLAAADVTEGGAFLIAKETIYQTYEEIKFAESRKKWMDIAFERMMDAQEKES